ncbi:Mitochondrial porin [Dimargaris cristalligena]|uniref:Eukaryotic porin/Tom40 n=1 Tax=Dimargaris cristalligena TaxID=215637 RepID=A0A4P9ZY20_9FUNG|nr:Mitochondrial porin [Dimargaris cristalligena]RKP38268.1 eukaryotic porin/Tom40 [Dimargaris cristalligena]|eukprot:RKP38268.1 eukaryotic porin/Tom40 [Dimargaris cristalligena]
MAVPTYCDIGKSSKDLLGKDFPIGSVKLEVKTLTANGVNFTVNGTQDQKSGGITGELKTKYADKVNGLTFTHSWTTKNLLTTEVEVLNQAAKGLKLNVAGSLLPVTGGAKNAKVTLDYKQKNLTAKSVIDLFKGPTFHTDLVVGRDGFLAGGEVGYDLLNGKVTKYTGALGYTGPDYAVALHALEGLNLFAASFYHRVSADVEAGAKATFDAKSTANAVNLEVGTKYYLDSYSFVKAKINNAGQLGLGYSQSLRPGVTVALGGLFDTSKLNENAHRLGLSLTFGN